MANYADPVSQNIEGVRQLVGSKLNKTSNTNGSNAEGVEEFVDELRLDMSDEELLQLARQWEDRYREYEASIKVRQEAQKTYYLGRQKEGSPSVMGDVPAISANLLFEAEETFLPAALSKNPEPVVFADNSPEGNAVSKSIKTMLQYHADTLVLRAKLTRMTRHWSIYFLGVLKHGWDPRIKDIKTDVVDPRKLILDPEGFVDDYADYEGYVGERKTVTARKLIKMFPEHKAYITVWCDGQLGSNLTYTEWWTDEYSFYTFKGKVLDKHLNPHYNYPTMVDGMDAGGASIQVEQQGINHFAYPKKPYTFLAVFNMGEQPHDVTGLIEQNIPNQRRLTRRTEQIDYNLSRSNNSDVFSAENFNQETAKQAAQAMAKGNPVLIPAGKPINEAIARLQGPGIGTDFFADLENTKTDLRSIFGTEGITAEQGNEDQTVRGQILNQSHDSTRIGGGIGDKIEQVADNVFNWWVQLYAVYYDEEHFGAIMGQLRAVEYQQLKSSDLNRRIVVSVAPDSMKPKDDITEMNQALALWEAKAIDPKTLLTILDFPDPQTTAENTVLWAVDPAAYMQINFPELAAKLQQLQMQQAQAQAVAPPGGGVVPEEVTEPSESISAPPASDALSNVPMPPLPA